MHRLIPLGVALCTLAASGLFGIGAALGQTNDVPSPAQGHASVIAQGVAALPASELAWRATLAATPPVADPPPPALAGFILADTGSLLLDDVEANRQTRLAAGEAAFIPTNAAPQEMALGSGSGAYYRIDLVPPSDVNSAGGEALIYVGQPFASPGGSRDLDLVRDVLAANESVTLPFGAYAAPALLLVTAGTIELVPAGDESAAPVALPAGQAAGIGGDVIARAVDSGATFVTAIVGPEISGTLAQEVAPTATSAPALASLTVQALACPVAYEGTRYAADCFEPLTGIAYSLMSPATGFVTAGTTAGDGFVAFTDLQADTYSLTGGVPGEFAVQVISCIDGAGAGVAEPGQSGVPGATIPLAAGAAVSCTWYVVPEDLQGETGGAAALTVHLCPGTPADPAADCSTGDATGVVISGPVTLTTDTSSEVAVSSNGTNWVWGEEGGLPSGTYTILPDGIPVPAGYEVSEVRGATGDADTGWTFVIDEANPNATLAVILVPAEALDPDADIDGDVLTNAQEAQLGTDPRNPDTDGDGLFDGPEFAIRTSPVLFDTDGDGFGDNDEAVARSNPNDPASVPTVERDDTDGDGLADDDEIAHGTNLANPDSDGDGVGDGAEVTNGTNPTDPASA